MEKPTPDQSFYQTRRWDAMSVCLGGMFGVLAMVPAGIVAAALGGWWGLALLIVMALIFLTLFALAFRHAVDYEGATGEPRDYGPRYRQDT